MTLAVSDISFEYEHRKEILHHVSLEVNSEEIVTLSGPSGKGKTTLLHCIAGLLTPTSGKIIVGGVDVTAMKPHERDIGIMMQNQPLYEHLSVEQNIAFPLRTRGSKRNVSSLLEQLELHAIAKQKVSKCSGGERRRVAFGWAVVIEPIVLLLDEPFISLNEELRDILLENIQRLRVSTLIVTHEHDKTVSDRVLTLEEL